VVELAEAQNQSGRGDRFAPSVEGANLSLNLCYFIILLNRRFFQDLVKSHLMFAVREEVEILKEQIKELLEKNQQLEYENGILRGDATPETLAKLQAGAPL